MDKRLIATIREVEERHWWFRARQEILLDLLSVFLDSGARILDVGCGTGYFLEAAAAFCHDRGLTDVRLGTVDDLGLLQEASTDAVCFFDVLEHLPDDLGT